MPIMLGGASQSRRSGTFSPCGLEPRALQFVREWAVLRQEEIMVNWERARRNEPLLGIEPLA